MTIRSAPPANPAAFDRHSQCDATRPAVSAYVAVLAAVVSGGLMAACYWPLNWHFLAWVAMVPWLIVLPQLSTRAAWLYGTGVGLVFYSIGLAWLFPVYGPIALPIVLALAVLMGLAFRVVRLLTGRFGLWAIIWAAPLAVTAQEIMRSEGLPLHRFSQLVLGYTQIHNLWVAQIASLGGVYLVSFLLVAANAAVAYAVIRRRRRALLPVGVLAGVVLILGALSQPRSYADRPELPVATVQAESPDQSDYARLVAQAADDWPDLYLIALPEHAIATPTARDEDQPLVKAMIKVASQSQTYISVGAHTLPDVNPTSGSAVWDKITGRCEFDNANLLVGPSGRIVFEQRKSIPMPFWPDGNPATEQKTFATPQGRLGLYVCYDESFSDVMRKLCDADAGLLVGAIYNGLHWPVQQRMQQADMMAFRAIELRRCMVRAASSGVSQIIDATGRVRASRRMSEGPGLLRGSVYFNDERTLLSRGGWLFAPIVTYAFLAIAGMMSLHEWGLAPRLRRAMVATRAARQYRVLCYSTVRSRRNIPDTTSLVDDASL